MRRALIHHDELDRTIAVPEISVTTYEKSGWHLVSKEPTQTPAAEAGATTSTKE